MDKEIYNTLYHFQEQGEEGYDLGEVMLLEDTSDVARIAKLTHLLNNEDRYIAYQAMLILISWNIQEGFDQFHQFYTERWDKTQEFEPHRTFGKDNVYDVFADAFANSLINGKNELQLLPFLKELLSIYPEVFFEGNLKDLLLKNDHFPQLLPEIENALIASLAQKMDYQASQLFPVLVKFDPKKYDAYLGIMESKISSDSRIKWNIEEAREIISRSFLVD